MALGPGTRIGPYEVAAQIGAGGMGEVYRARDTRLDRDVAIKVLPESFASDPDRLARFQREARTLAALNHANIAQIHGLEEAHGVCALVMELVTGPTLADRIAQGPIPLREALPIARQVAEALEAAHEHGIIHRDLKPANIKVREDEMVKVLDFGLAKALEPAGAASHASQSPTLTTPAMTRAGMILGTAAYMSPEQARGKVMDKRADIWAFGCVLYEMLTGQRAFGGEDVSDTMAAVLKETPDFDRVPAAAPFVIRRLLRRCLEKDARRRLRDIGDARSEIEDVLSGAHLSARDAAVGDRAQRRLRVPWSIAAAASVVALTAVAALAWNVWKAPQSETALPRVSRFAIASSGAAALSIEGNDRDLAITPDGDRVVYVSGNGTQLLLRPLEQLDATMIATGAGLRAIFVAPEGQRVGFVDSTSSLMKVAISGGPAVTIAHMDGTSRGATWGPDDTIIFGTGAVTTGLQRVSADGGTVTVLTRPARDRGEGDHVWPEMLPGGHAVLFTITAATGGFDASQVAVFDLETGTSTALVPGGSHAHYVPGRPGSPGRAEREGGFLVYTARGTLRAISFDLARLKTRGTPVAVLAGVLTTQQGAADFDVAADGTLAYVGAPGASSTAARTLTWVDRQGREETIAAAPARPYMYPRVSPDGTRVAVAITDQDRDIWVWDLVRQGLTRWTMDPAFDVWPVWTRDGHLLFTSSRAGASNLYVVADAAGTIERLTQTTNQQHPTSVSPDGRQVIFHEVSPSMRRDLMMVALDGTHHVQPLLQTQFEERNGLVSPDGHWLAYESDSSGSGRFEIYVRPFPNASAGPQSQVSTAGGTRPLWARSGQELFFIAQDGALMAVRADVRGGTWSAGPPAKLLPAGYFTGNLDFGRSYDVAPDGRFLMIKEVGGESRAPQQIVVVQNWLEELRRVVPR